MKTKQYISTICYSTSSRMKLVLDGLVTTGKLDFYVFIEHKKEEDELKDHKHLLVFPSSAVNTSELDVALIDLQEDGQKLGTCGIWKTVGKNNVSDWLLYALHEPMYMRLKGYDDRKYTYKDSEFITSNEDGLFTLIFDAFHDSKFTFNRRIIDLLLRSPDISQSGRELVLNGYIPLNSTCSFHHLLQICKGG